MRAYTEINDVRMMDVFLYKNFYGKIGVAKLVGSAQMFFNCRVGVIKGFEERIWKLSRLVVEAILKQRVDNVYTR